MKKILLLLCIAIISNAMIANENPVFDWAAYIKVDGTTTSTTSSPASIRKNSQSNLFAFGTFGSHTTKGLSTSYKLIPYNEVDAPELFATGAPYTGNSCNNNFFLYKMDINGKVIWQVSSNMGDVSTNNSAMIPTTDGGAFLALKVRHTNKNENNNNVLLGIVDQDGIQTNVEWTYPGFWAYQGVFIKISSAGKVEWTKKITVSTDVRDNFATSKTEITDGFAFNDLATDESGYLYLAGSYVNDITFDSKTLIPHNGDNWAGDVQYAQNDLFLVKLNNAGEYVWDLVTTGKVKNETASSISYDNGYLYMLGNLQGDESKTMYLGAYPATPTEKTDAYTAKIKTNDGSVEWLKHFASLPKSGAGGRIKIVSTQYSNGMLLTSGSFTGVIADADKTPIETNTNGTMLQGFVIKQNSATGEVGGLAIAPISSISEYSRSFYLGESLHVIGYNMAQGQYYITYDSDLTNASEPFILMKASASPTSFDACFHDNMLVAFGRGRGTITFTGTEETSSYPAFGNILSCYAIPSLTDSATGITTDSENNNIKIYTNDGTIYVNFEGTADITLYAIDGRLIDNNIASNSYSRAVQKGIYVLRINNKSFKISVK